MLSDRGHVYNNLIVNISGNAFEDDNDNTPGLHGNDWDIYNNTLYNVGFTGITAGSNDAGHGWSVSTTSSRRPALTSLLRGWRPR